MAGLAALAADAGHGPKLAANGHVGLAGAGLQHRLLGSENIASRTELPAEQFAFAIAGPQHWHQASCRRRMEAQAAWRRVSA